MADRIPPIIQGIASFAAGPALFFLLLLSIHAYLWWFDA